jgi:hypothetical protein
MAKICSSIVGDNDVDIAELLYKEKGMNVKDFQYALCFAMNPTCRLRPKPFTGTRPGEDFIEADPEMLKMTRMMASMEAQGLSGDVRLPASSFLHDLHRFAVLRCPFRCPWIFGHPSSFSFGKPSEHYTSSILAFQNHLLQTLGIV